MILLCVGQLHAAPPQRIVSAMPSITEMLYALDLGDRIVGVTTNCDYPPEAKRKEKIGDIFLNLEKVASLKPDMVIMLEDAQQKDIEKIKRFGLPVYSLNVKSVDDVLSAILELGVLTNRVEKARELTRKMKQRIAAVEERARNPKPSLVDVLNLWRPKEGKRKALVIVGLEPLVVAGGGTFIDDILEKAGVENVAIRTRAAYPQYSFERLVSENPQYIIIPKNLLAKEQVLASKRWQSLEAVRQNRVLFIDANILTRPGPRVVEAIEKIAEFIY